MLTLNQQEAYKMFDEFEKIQQEMDRLFNSFFKGPRLVLSKPNQDLIKFSPATSDVKETDKEIIATFDIPGIKKEDIKISVTEDSIKISAEKKEEKEVKEENFYKKERAHTGYFREFSLPTFIKANEVSADYKEGVLTVKMPKQEPNEEKEHFDVDVK